jgi:hypothetical protein
MARLLRVDVFPSTEKPGGWTAHALKKDGSVYEVKEFEKLVDVSRWASSLGIPVVLTKPE